MFLKPLEPRAATIMEWVWRTAIAITAAVQAVGMLLLIEIDFVQVGSLLVFLVVGPWDLLVWLTKSDWRTTHFVWPVRAAVICAVLAIVSWGLVFPLGRRLESLRNWLERRLNSISRARL